MTYKLLYSYNPCNLFKHFGVTEMHGLSLEACERYNDTNSDAYIAGLSNLSPIDGKPFVFINLSRCTDTVRTMGLIFHEMMHMSGILFDGDWENQGEEMITFAEKETYKVYEIIKKALEKGTNK